MTSDRVQRILQAYPTEPDWALEDDATLIELVQGHAQQPDCAAAVLRELAQRQHAAVGDLSLALLVAQDADKWVKLEAFRSLPTTHMAQGFEAARDLVDSCPVVVLEMLAAAVHEMLQGDMPEVLRNHDVVKKLGGGRYWGDDGDGNVIHFAGSLTRDEYLQAEQLISGKTLVAWQIALFLSAWALLAGVLTWLNQLPIPAMMMLLLGLALGVIAKIWYGKATTWDQNPDYRKHYYGTLSEAGIDTHGSNTWRFSPWSEWMSWNADDDMLVVLSTGGARILPVSHFASWAEWEVARALCAQHLTKTETKGDEIE